MNGPKGQLRNIAKRKLHALVILLGVLVVGFENCSPVGRVAGDFATGIGTSDAASRDGSMIAKDSTVTNVMEITPGQFSPAYETSGSCAATFPAKIAFDQKGNVLRAYSGPGNVVWEKTLPDDAGFYTGFDFNQDGCYDIALVRTKQLGTICGSTPRTSSWIELMNGRDGSAVTMNPPIPETPDICWTFGSTIYPTTQWTSLTPLFGAGGTLAFAPYYAKVGMYYAWNGSEMAQTGTYLYPSTSQYDATYVNAKNNAYGNGLKHTDDPHVGNGFVTKVNGEDRLVYFTSGRMVQYKTTAQGADQLVTDSPYLTGGRTDLVGRNYGLVRRDPGDPNRVVIVTGPSVFTMMYDLQRMWQGTVFHTTNDYLDPYGQIERHVSVVRLDTGAVDDKYYSYAHDNNDAYNFQKRLSYPDNDLLAMPSGPSRIVYNEYRDGDWHVHVSLPGATADEVDLPYLFVWDIVDLDGDGRQEIILSDTRDPSDTSSGYYFPKVRTRIVHWDEASKKLTAGVVLNGVLPLLSPRSHEADVTSNRGSINRVAFRRALGQATEILTYSPSSPTLGTFVAIPPEPVSK